MEENTLLVVDRIDINILKLLNDNDLAGKPVSMLVLGVHADAFAHANMDVLRKNKNISMLSINDVSDNALAKTREFIPGFVYRFPIDTKVNDFSIIDLFRYKNINFWWFNKMSEKGAWGTPLIKRIYFLEVVRSFIIKHRFKVVVADLCDKAFAATLKINEGKTGFSNVVRLTDPYHRINSAELAVKYLLKIVYVYTRYISSWILLRLLNSSKNKDVAAGSIAFFSIYPLFWKKRDEGSVSELFFKEIPQILRKHADACFAVWFTDSLLNILRKRISNKRIFKGNIVSVLECNIGFFDLFSSLKHTFAYSTRVFKYILSYRKAIAANAFGLDISPIVEEECTKYFTNSEPIRCILLMKSVEAFVRIRKPRVIIFRVEFQPYERAVIYGSKGRCRTIAFQHQAIAKNHLQYVFPVEEIRNIESIDFPQDKLPVSDHYCVTGEYAHKVFKDSGFSEEKVKICGPLRYIDMVEYIKGKPSKESVRKKLHYDTDSKIFLIAAPVTYVDTVSLMVNLLNAIKGMDKKIRFLIKSHPVMKFDGEMKRLIDSMSPEQVFEFLSDDVNLNEYLVMSDAVLLTGATVGIEAICLGVTPIVFENNSSFSLNPMLEVSDSCFFAGDSAGLRDAVMSVCSKSEVISQKTRNWPEAIKNVFYNVADDPAERFIMFLKENEYIVDGNQYGK